MACKMFCLMWHSKPNSAEPDGSPSYRFRRSDDQTKRYEEHHKTDLKMQKKVVMKPGNSLTLEEWLLPSPAGLKPDHLKRGEFCTFKNPRKKIHPSSSSQVPRRLISEAKDSLCLDRPMSHNNCKQEEGEGEGEEEGKSETLSVISGKKQKRVSFKLPHVVILYSPEEEEPYGYNNSSKDSFNSPSFEGNCRGGSFQSPDELCFRLAVNTLPHISSSSRLSET